MLSGPGAVLLVRERARFSSSRVKWSLKDSELLEVNETGVLSLSVLWWVKRGSVVPVRHRSAQTIPKVFATSEGSVIVVLLCCRTGNGVCTLRPEMLLMRFHTSVRGVSLLIALM